MRRSGFLALESSLLTGSTPVGGPVIDARRSHRGGFISAQDHEIRAIEPPTVPVPVRESAFAVLHRYLFGWQIDPRWGQAGNRYPRAQTDIGMTFKMPFLGPAQAQVPRPMRPRPRYTKVLPYPRPGKAELPQTYGPYNV